MSVAVRRSEVSGPADYCLPWRLRMKAWWNGYDLAVKPKRAGPPGGAGGVRVR